MTPSGAGDPPRDPRRDLSESGVFRAQRAEKRLTLAMTGLALVALLALLVDYGLGPGPLRPLWRRLETAAAVLFVVLQCLKPAVVPRPLEYLRRHRLDFILIALLIFGAVNAHAIRSSTEFRYLMGHGAADTLEALPILAIQAYLLFLLVLKSPWFQRALLALPLGSITALWTSFAVLIGAGTLLLRLPGATAAGRQTGWIDALFTITSAACVTGLTVVDTGSHFSGFGQAVILAAIQIGGLGVLTMTGSVALLAGEALSPTERRGLADLSEADALPQIRSALVRPVLFTLGLEALGAAALYFVWRGPGEVGGRIWSAVFHAISAFCNAGFGLSPDNLGPYAASPATLSVIALLIVCGGIGFGVLWELARAMGSLLLLRRPGPLTPHARAALRISLALIAGGGIALWLLERGDALAPCPPGTRLLNALFLSVSARTAGFATSDLSRLTLAGSGLLVVLMLVGGSPGGTAGGFKTTTLRILFGRGLQAALRRRALAGLLAVVAGFLLTGVALRLIVHGAVAGTWFESASAIGTVGLSRGATPRLPDAARLVLVAAMLFGRLGPFVIAFALRRRARRAGLPVDAEPYQVG